MSKLVNIPTTKNVNAFIAAVKNKKRKADAHLLLQLMEELTGNKGKIWGVSIIGFGKYSYTRNNGTPAEWFNVGFSPASAHTTVYVMYDITEEKTLLAQLGPHKTGKGCLYIKDLNKIDLKILSELIKKSKRWKHHVS